MYTQELFGIKIFDFEEAQPWDEGTQYIDVTFHLDDLKKYDACSLEIDQEWNVCFWTHDGNKIAEFCIIDIPDFKSQLAMLIK